MSPLRLGMVGGGQGAFIGGVHRMAARLDGRFQLVAGAFSSDPARAEASAKELGVERSYADFRTMAQEEAKRADGIQAVSIVTPNHLHGEIAAAFLMAGIHVICDKPMTATLAQADELVAVAKKSEAEFFLTHNYTGYPMVRQMRQLIRERRLGAVRRIHVEYLQDWLADAPDPDNKQAAWRTDPSQAGGGAIGDIGTHAYNLMRFVTGLKTKRLSADLSSVVPGRAVDDDARVAMHMIGGAKAHLWASQIATGNENNLTLRIYGEKAALAWAQENPNMLTFTPLGAAPQIMTRGGAASLGDATAVTRIPGGHPEGYLEAFATIYREAADAIENGKTVETLVGLEDGLEGMQFVDACQRSSVDNGNWVQLN